MKKSPANHLEISFRDIAHLIPYARNARTHSDEQVRQLMGSMMEYGFTNPVLADSEGIVAGHGRCLAAGRLYEMGKTIKLPSGEALPAGTVPVLDCTGWSNAQRRAYILADNQLALNADWDEDLLRVELEDLRALDVDLESLGFDEEELDGLMGEGESPNAQSEPHATCPACGQRIAP